MSNLKKRIDQIEISLKHCMPKGELLTLFLEDGLTEADAIGKWEAEHGRKIKQEDLVVCFEVVHRRAVSEGETYARFEG